MVKEERLRSKILYKIELFLLKIIPMLMAVCSACNSILSYFDIEVVIINYIGGVSLLPLIFLYLSSYVFKFCAFHRLFIHYYAFIDILNVSDHYLHPYFNEKIVTGLHDGVTVVFIITAIIMYIYKYKREKCMKVLNSCGNTEVLE